jgi:hypothetical protein
LGAAQAASPEADPPSMPDVPFAQHVETGEILYLGMSKEEADAITGEPLEENRFRQMVYEGVTLQYRDGLVVYIEIQIHDDDPRWAANGVVTPNMPTKEALEALGMPFEPGNDPYTIWYFEDGTQTMHDRNPPPEDSRRDYLWCLTFFADRDTVGVFKMGDKQYLTMMK